MATAALTDHPPPLLPRPPDLLLNNTKITIETRRVWNCNLESEFSIIRDIIDQYSFVSMDTEFPGVVNRPHQPYPDPPAHYLTLKSNVDALKLIQVGITLTDCYGNLPDLGSSDRRFIWEFNFCDFDISLDQHAPTSVELLRKQGIDFDAMHEFGASISHFAELMMSSGLVCNGNVTYITFHSGYDFGYLIKAITGKALPNNLPEFLNLLMIFFGNRVYDVKYLMKFCKGLHGGLDSVAKTVGAERAVGKSHQAGSDSLLTWHTFEKIRAGYFRKCEKDKVLETYAGVLYGLELFDT